MGPASQGVFVLPICTAVDDKKSGDPTQADSDPRSKIKHALDSKYKELPLKLK